MARLELPSEDAMTGEQRAVRDEVVAGKRGRVPSPMIAWIQSPEVARRSQQLGEVLRYDTTLESTLVELATLVCARHWTAHQVWTSHKRHGLKAGLSEAVVDAIAANARPPFTNDREQLVYDVAGSLLTLGQIPQGLYARAVAGLGARGLVELVAVIGYYGYVSLTANAFELGLPQNIAPELNDLVVLF